MARLDAGLSAVLRHLLCRLGLAFVFLWFGSGELLHPGQWIGYIPLSLQHIGIAPQWMILVHGWLLFVIGGFLLMGLYTRVMGAAAVVMMASIVVTLLTAHGINSIVARDMGLLALAVSVALDPSRVLSWDAVNTMATPAHGISGAS